MQPPPSYAELFPHTLESQHQPRAVPPRPTVIHCDQSYPEVPLRSNEGAIDCTAYAIGAIATVKLALEVTLVIFICAGCAHYDCQDFAEPVLMAVLLIVMALSDLVGVVVVSSPRMRGDVRWAECYFSCCVCPMILSVIFGLFELCLMDWKTFVVGFTLVTLLPVVLTLPTCILGHRLIKLCIEN